MMPNVDLIIEEFERLSLDDKLYLEFNAENELRVSILFKRGEPRCWSLWYTQSEENSKQNCSRAHLPSVLQGFKVSLNEFTREIASCLLTQAAYADEFVREITRLLGHDAVSQSIRQTQDFMEALQQSVSRMLETNNTPTPLEAVKLDSLPNPKGRLRIVKT